MSLSNTSWMEMRTFTNSSPVMVKFSWLRSLSDHRARTHLAGQIPASTAKRFVTQLPPNLQMNFSILLSRHRDGKREWHHQGRTSTRRTSRRTSPSVPQSICGMGRPLQDHSWRSTDTSWNSAHRPGIQRTSTH